jgi:hypothetical protein
MCCVLCEADWIFLELRPASVEFVFEKCKLDGKSFEQQCILNDCGLVVMGGSFTIHRQTSFGLQAHLRLPASSRRAGWSNRTCLQKTVSAGDATGAGSL